MPKLKSTTGTTKGVAIRNTPTTTATAPDGTKGDLYYDSDKGVLMVYDTTWSAVSAATASGGTEIIFGSYTVHQFTGDGTFVVSGGEKTCDILVVAGGGSGGSHHGSGGGAGGLLFGTGITCDTSHVIDVGAGGGGTAFNTAGIAGEDSSITNLPAGTATAIGGGRGAYYIGGGQDGGCGGGSRGPGGGDPGDSTQGDSGGLEGFGNDGGQGTHSGGYGCGAGGGAGAVGGQGSSNVGGTGGVGKDYSAIFGTSAGGSPAGWFAGGGGGAAHGSGNPGAGGQGGGAAGTINPDGINGTVNTGGGGGGHDRPLPSGDGGSGIVLIRYPS